MELQDDKVGIAIPDSICSDRAVAVVKVRDLPCWFNGHQKEYKYEHMILVGGGGAIGVLAGGGLCVCI